jgi:hypothetical protein
VPNGDRAGWGWCWWPEAACSRELPGRSSTSDAFKTRSCMKPDETTVTATRWPGGNPARESHLPLSRMPEKSWPFQGSPRSSILRVRLATGGEAEEWLGMGFPSPTEVLCIFMMRFLSSAHRDKTKKPSPHRVTVQFAVGEFLEAFAAQHRQRPLGRCHDHRASPSRLVRLPLRAICSRCREQHTRRSRSVQAQKVVAVAFCRAKVGFIGPEVEA